MVKGRCTLLFFPERACSVCLSLLTLLTTNQPYNHRQGPTTPSQPTNHPHSHTTSQKNPHVPESKRASSRQGERHCYREQCRPHWTYRTRRTPCQSRQTKLSHGKSDPFKAAASRTEDEPCWFKDPYAAAGQGLQLGPQLPIR